MKFKLFGTEIYISFPFAAITAFMLAADKSGLALPTLFAAFIHEAGHLFAMRAAECQPKSIRLIPASIQIVRSFSRKSYSEALIALFGPLANLTVYLTLRLCYSAFHSEGILEFAFINLLLGIFNMLPVNGLDGGSILKLILERHTDTLSAEKAVRLSGFLIGAAAVTAAIILTVKGKFNPTLYIAAVYFILTALLKF